MYRVDIENKQLIRLSPTKFSDLHLMERFDIQEWVEKTPEILGEELLIISKELRLPSGKRLDLLAIDKKANLVVIELKRDDAGADVEWQAIKYTSYCSNFSQSDIFGYYAEYIRADIDEAQLRIEGFIEEELEKLNNEQRIILVSKEFHSDVVSAVLWLRDYQIDIKCIRLRLYLGSNNELLITPDEIIPLPEAKDYIQKKEAKLVETKRAGVGSFSLEKGNYEPDELKAKLKASLMRKSDLTPRLISFLSIILSYQRTFSRDEVKTKLFEEGGVGSDIGQAGRYLSGISQFLTKKANLHLRQVVEFESGGTLGETKDNYRVIDEYRVLLEDVLREVVE